MCAKMTPVEGLVGKYEGDVYKVLNDKDRTAIWCEIPKQTIRLGKIRRIESPDLLFRIPDGVNDPGTCGEEEGQYFVSMAALEINGFKVSKER